MKKLLLSILVAIAAVLSSCKATVEPDNAAAIAGNYKITTIKYTYTSGSNTYNDYDYVYSNAKIELVRVSNTKLTVNITNYYTDEYKDITVTKSGSNYTLSGKSSSGDTFSGSITGNSIELGINESGTVYTYKGSK